MTAPAFATMLLGALVLLFPRTATSALPDASTQAASRSLLHAADTLDRLAAAARLTPRNKVSVPDVQLSPAVVSATPAGRPSLNRWLQSQLEHIRKEKSGRAQVRELRELAAAVRRAAQPGIGVEPIHDPHSEVAAILAQRTYQTGGAGPAPVPHETLLEKIVRWLEERIGAIFERIFGATASVPIIGRIVSILFIALLAGLAAFLIFLLVSAVIRRRRPALIDEGTPLQERIEPDFLYQLGMAAANEGHYARAVSLLFQASLASFDRAGKLPYDESLTAGEYRRAVRRTISSASPYFDDIARAFVLAAFAERPISKDDFMSADVAYRSLGSLLAS